MLSASPVTPAPTRRPPRTDYEALVEKIDVLEEQLRQARAELVPARVFPARWGLTGQQAHVLSFLLARAPAPKSGEQIIAGLNAAGYRADHFKMPDVVICAIRKKVKVDGVLIHTKQTVGYYLDKATAARVDDLCASAALGLDAGADQSVIIVRSPHPPAKDVIEHVGKIGAAHQLRAFLREMHAEGVRRWPDMIDNEFDSFLREVLL